MLDLRFKISLSVAIILYHVKTISTKCNWISARELTADFMHAHNNVRKVMRRNDSRNTGTSFYWCFTCIGYALDRTLRWHLNFSFRNAITLRSPPRIIVHALKLNVRVELRCIYVSPKNEFNCGIYLSNCDTLIDRRNKKKLYIYIYNKIM